MINWPQLSIIITSYSLGLLTGVILALISHRLAMRREKDKEKRDVIVTCNFQTKEGNWWTTDISEADYEVITLTATNNCLRPLVIADAGFYLENGKPFRPSKNPSNMWDNPRKIDEAEYVNYSMRMTDAIKVMRDNKSLIGEGFIYLSTEEIFRIALSDEQKQYLDRLTFDKGRLS